MFTYKWNSNFLTYHNKITLNIATIYWTPAMSSHYPKCFIYLLNHLIFLPTTHGGNYPCFTAKKKKKNPSHRKVILLAKTVLLAKILEQANCRVDFRGESVWPIGWAALLWMSRRPHLPGHSRTYQRHWKWINLVDVPVLSSWTFPLILELHVQLYFAH